MRTLSLVFGLCVMAWASSVVLAQRDAQPLALSYADDQASPPPAKTLSQESTSTETTPVPLLWNGFLYGDQHFRDKPRNVGSPIYFEDPFINTDIRAIYLWHKFPKGSQLRGGQLQVGALAARVALTDRLQFIAVKDGYSHIESPILDDASGWNDLGIGAKYALYVDHENDFLVSTGLRWLLSNGHAETLNGNVDELAPFVSVYKGWGKFNFLADVGGRIAMDEHRGNHILNWDVHMDYEVCKHFFPLIEFHGLHYLSDADRLPLSVGGLDYANIGSSNVAGTGAYWGGVGFHVPIIEHVSWNVVYEFPLQNPSDNDIFDQRVTTNLSFVF